MDFDHSGFVDVPIITPRCGQRLRILASPPGKYGVGGKPVILRSFKGVCISRSWEVIPAQNHWGLEIITPPGGTFISQGWPPSMWTERGVFQVEKYKRELPDQSTRYRNSSLGN